MLLRVKYDDTEAVIFYFSVSRVRRKYTTCSVKRERAIKYQPSGSGLLQVILRGVN